MGQNIPTHVPDAHERHLAIRDVAQPMRQQPFVGGEIIAEEIYEVVVSHRAPPNIIQARKSLEDGAYSLRIGDLEGLHCWFLV
jgi:hypothetical protein